MQPILSRITHPAPSTVPVKNIIFDFGGVICNIDVKRSEKAFRDLGFSGKEAKPGEYDAPALYDAVERGLLDPAGFREELRRFIPRPVTDNELDAAWNALLLDIPRERIALLRALAGDYRIFLLSNSNEIHYYSYSARLLRDHGCRFEDLFEKTWFSYRIRLCKPSPEIFRYVLRDGGLVAGETLFIDDTLMHVEGARKEGIQAIHLDLSKDEEVTDLFL
ncbi:MAG TPA: HAD family phosphatase [Bacteroidales bacterium]|nr:HAD family phosphatase [Bacteroidales bacterium]HPS63304.1 HAD family phosphatase [Bacteroidales bacterium]